MPANDITVVGTDPGVCAFNGGTHMPFEDVALPRHSSAPTLDITDTVMLENILRQAVNLPGVKYLRVAGNRRQGI